MRFYLHKYYLGMHPYYQMMKYKETYKFGDKDQHPHAIMEKKDEHRDGFFKLRKEMLQRSQSIVFRVIMQVRFDGHILKNDNIFPNDYSGNHIVIFENQLKSPPTMALIDHNLSEFLNLNRINFRNWKIVDVDNYMRGNPFFSKMVQEKEWNAHFEKKVGKKASLSV